MATMRRRKQSPRILLSGRNIAIAVVALVSCLSFALGYFVGRATSVDEVEIVSYSQTPAAEPAADETLPVQEQTAESVPVPVHEPPAPETNEEAEIPEPVIYDDTETAPTGDENLHTEVEKKGKILYSVQVGAFQNPEDSEVLKKKLKGMGYTVYVVSSAGDKPTYRVRVGKTADRKSAEILAVKLKRTQNLKGFVVRVD
jgi:cell division septation protein DedD